MRFSVLGPLEVHDGATPVAIGTGQQRKLLAALLVHANETVPTDRLMEALWGERPPDTAAKALQGYVSQLRKRLGTGAVETNPGGYRLRVSDDDVDARRFEAMLAEARALDRLPAATRLREALVLWRGAPYSEFAYDDFARGEIGRLEELRLSCLERRIELDLALGRHDDLVAELEALVREHPLRERFRRQLILALYRSGRQADALDAYSEARKTFRDDLGLEPGEELQALQRAILAQDSSIAAPPRVELPRTVSPARGRAQGRRRMLVIAVAGGALLAAAAAAALVLTLRGGAPPHAVVVPFDSVALVDPASGRITGFAPVGRRPVALAVGDDGVWVVNADDGTVQRLDPKAARVVATVGIGADVSDVATGFGSVWVADGNDGTVTRIDARSNQPVRTIAPPGSKALAANPVFLITTDDRYVWATQGGRLLRIDPRSYEIKSSAAVGAITSLATGGGFVWVTTTGSQLYRVDPRSLRVTAAPGLDASGATVTFGGRELWLPIGAAVGAVDPVTFASFALGGLPDPFVLAFGDDALWLAGEHSVSRVDLQSMRVRWTDDLGHRVTDVAVTPRHIWVSVARST